MLNDQITIEEAIADCEREQRLADHADGRDVLTLGDHAAWVEQNEGVEWIVLGEFNRSFGCDVAIVPPLGGAIDDRGTNGIAVVISHPLMLPGEEIRVLGRNVAECMPGILEKFDAFRERLAAASDRQQCGSTAPAAGDRGSHADDLAGAE